MRAGIFLAYLHWFFRLCFFSNISKIPPGRWRGVLLLDRMPVMKYGDDRDVVKNLILNLNYLSILISVMTKIQ